MLCKSHSYEAYRLGLVSIFEKKQNTQEETYSTALFFCGSVLLLGLLPCSARHLRAASAKWIETLEYLNA